MSTAHRPTWDPAQAREVKGGSRQFSSRDMAAHTKLKFRQPGQTSTTDVAKRDLRAELALAEHEAKNKKRKAAGQPPLPWAGAGAAPLAIADAPAEDEEAHKRRKVLQEALEMDRDDSEDDTADDEPADADAAKPKAAADGSDDDSDDEDSDDEDETAVLLRELEKIKRERAADQARADASAAASRDAAVATANPLLNLAAALGADAPVGVSTTAPGTFAVKRRWDDDVIFKNQASGQKDRSGEFVNDLLRTEFHRKFMAKFIK